MFIPTDGDCYLNPQHVAALRKKKAKGAGERYEIVAVLPPGLTNLTKSTPLMDNPTYVTEESSEIIIASDLSESEADQRLVIITERLKRR